MIRLLILSLVILSASCAVPPAASTASPTAMPTSAAETRIIVRQSTPPATLVAAPATPSPVTTSAAQIGWRTFIDSDLHLAVDYPPDWTAHLQDHGATFTSPQGLTIQLVPIDPQLLSPSGEIIQPNTRCADTVNPHGLPVRTCRATIGFSLGAYLQIKTVSGLETAAAISTGDRGAFDVFNAIVESARLAP